MRNLLITTGVAASMLFATSCSTPCPEAPVVEELNMDSVHAEIAALESAFESASNARDIEGVLVYYADDAVRYPPNGPAINGKEAIRAKMIENQDTSDHSTIQLSIVDLWAAGDQAVEIGSWQSLAADGSTQAAGTYMCVFEQRDGKYLCIRDIWNSNMPSEDMTAAE